MGRHTHRIATYLGAAALGAAACVVVLLGVRGELDHTLGAATLGAAAPTTPAPLNPHTPADGEWAPAPGVLVQTGDLVPDPGDTDPTLANDDVRLDAYTAVLTTTNSGRKLGPARWHHPVSYHIDLPAEYPAGVADEVRTAYRWMSAVAGIDVYETADANSANIRVRGHDNNGGLTIYDAVHGQLSNVTVQIGCCRRSPIWEEALHSMGLISDLGPEGSAVAAYDARPRVLDVTSAADATVLRALYRYELGPHNSDREVRDAIRTTAARHTP